MREIVKSRTELRKQSERVEHVSAIREEIQELKDILESLKNSAVGLAAPQIGIFKRFIGIRPPGEDLRVLINPKIIQWGKKNLDWKEGCLSFPDEIVKTLRYNFIEVEFLDEEGNSQQERFKGFTGVIAQHEIDHLDGKLMFDNSPKKYDLCPCGSRKKYKFCNHVL